MALAAVSFAACSNDDAPAAGGENQGELVDAISVYFTNPKTTYAYSEAVGGDGTESNVYHAFIFAKENNPEHAAALVGDWTVREVKGEKDGDPIKAGDEGKPSTLKNMATFKGVRQGDNVYVIANDPNMNLSAAEKMAHQGKDSEAAIKAYTSTLTKEYLNSLAVKSEKATQPTGKFIMAGKATIPTNPTQPNNTTMRVPVTLDREVAKVVFSATVTNNSEQEAYTKVKIKEDDGIIIARIPRSVSFYADQIRDWYFPLNGDITTKDWGTDWVVAFDGETKASPKGETPAFNNTAKKGAKEYRYTWDGTSSLASYTAPKDIDPVDGGQIASPIFYVTPNYANHSSCATVIVTQATYVGDNTLVRDVTAEILKDALKQNTFPGITEITGDFWAESGDGDNLSKLYTFLTTNYANLFPAKTYESKSDLIGYKKNQKVYYRADVSNYTDDNLTSLNVTERNTFYQIQGTISSLGATTVDAAIEGSELGMIVQVTVNPWKVVVNRVDM